MSRGKERVLQDLEARVMGLVRETADAHRLIRERRQDKPQYRRFSYSDQDAARAVRQILVRPYHDLLPGLQVGFDERGRVAATAEWKSMVDPVTLEERWGFSITFDEVALTDWLTVEFVLSAEELSRAAMATCFFEAMAQPDIEATVHLRITGGDGCDQSTPVGTLQLGLLPNRFTDLSVLGPETPRTISDHPPPRYIVFLPVMPQEIIIFDGASFPH
jgi:hypothetical protein